MQLSNMPIEIKFNFMQMSSASEQNETENGMFIVFHATVRAESEPISETNPSQIKPHTRNCSLEDLIGISKSADGDIKMQSS